jgi:hypothetical protein
LAAWIRITRPIVGLGTSLPKVRPETVGTSPPDRPSSPRRRWFAAIAAADESTIGAAGAAAAETGLAAAETAGSRPGET